MADLAKSLERIGSVPWRAVGLVIGVSFVCASLVSTVTAHLFLPSATKLTKTSTVAMNGGIGAAPTAPSLDQKGIEAIMRRNLFGAESTDADTGEKKDGPKTAEAIKSDLPVKLLGTIYGGDPLSGIAIVENSQKHTVNSFMVGDTLVSNAQVKEVHREKIIVEREGHLEYIDVDRQELARGRRVKKKAAPAPSPGIAPIATEPPPSTFKTEGLERDRTSIVMTQSFKQKLLGAEFPKVLQDAKATPNVVDGELRGFTLTRIRKDSIYEMAGLQNDDIVEEINGVPLNDTPGAIRLLQSLRNEAEIDVRINRAGQVMKFTLNVK